jgi:hypothetical protein
VNGQGKLNIWNIIFDFSVMIDISFCNIHIIIILTKEAEREIPRSLYSLQEQGGNQCTVVGTLHSA